MSKPHITNFAVTDISPTVARVGVKYAKLIPKTLRHQHVVFEVKGAPACVANAIRRLIDSELRTCALECSMTDIETTEMFILQEMICQRLRMIPLLQTCPADATFELNANNMTAVVRTVYTGEITCHRLKTLPFNENMPLLDLNPGKAIKISNIRVLGAYGYMPGFGTNAMGVNTSSVCLDVIPFNPYTGEGVRSRHANPQHHRVSFNTNGILPPKQMLLRSCDEIIDRTDLVVSAVGNIESSADEYYLKISGETETIGELFTRAIHETVPNIICVVYTIDPIAHTCTIRIRADTDDIGAIITTAGKWITQIFNSLKSQIELL